MFAKGYFSESILLLVKAKVISSKSNYSVCVVSSTVKLVLSDHVRAKQVWSLNGGGL